MDIRDTLRPHEGRYSRGEGQQEEEVMMRRREFLGLTVASLTLPAIWGRAQAAPPAPDGEIVAHYPLGNPQSDAELRALIGPQMDSLIQQARHPEVVLYKDRSWGWFYASDPDVRMKGAGKWRRPDD
jgi:hypothetical protein